MTPKYLLIAALAVGLLLLHGSGAAPATGTVVEQLDEKLEGLTQEDVLKYLTDQQQVAITWLQDNKEKIKAEVDQLLGRVLAVFSKPITPEYVAYWEQKLSDFDVEDFKKTLYMLKLLKNTQESVKEEVKDMLSN